MIKVFSLGQICLALLVGVFIVHGTRGTEQKLTNTVYVPKTSIIAAAPKGDLIAVARSPIPDTQVPERPDNDGSLVFVKVSKLIDSVISHRFFSGRFITKLVWSPDGQFLVMSSESAGGHSPWHLNSYFWSRADRQFRSVDFRAGQVVSDDFTFTAPHTLTVKIAATAADGTLETDHQVDKTIDLAELQRQIPPLRATPWP
jgi:hypothetical protein